MRIALYQSQYSTSPNNADSWIEDDKDYVRISEIVEVEFPPLPKEIIVNKQIESIENEITKVRAEMTCKVNELEQRKQELLALPSE